MLKLQTCGCKIMKKQLRYKCTMTLFYHFLRYVYARWQYAFTLRIHTPVSVTPSAAGVNNSLSSPYIKQFSYFVTRQTCFYLLSSSRSKSIS